MGRWREPAAQAAAGVTFDLWGLRMNLRWTKGALPAMAVWLWGCTTPAPDLGPAGVSGAPTWSPAMETRRLTLVQSLSKSGISAVRNKDDQLQFNLPTDFAFASDSADIKAEMKSDLDQLAASLNGPSVLHMRLQVVGYTDSQGSDAVNDSLSLARARSVAQYIQGKGVNAARITVEGRGEKQPMVSNDQSYGRALNRRVEIVLTDRPAPP
jgi:outer membrane protein OmpA-like peptidoglycan-associated protein